MKEEECLRLLGVVFDRGLNFRQHLRSVSIRANQRLGFLRRASSILDSRSRQSVYNGFVRPLMEYCPLVWMGSASSNLARLDLIQHRALKMIESQFWLPSLHLRRLVAACTYLYKLHYIRGEPALKCLLPPSAPERQACHFTRHQASTVNQPSFQLHANVTGLERDSVLRAFPNGVVNTWNMLPPKLLHQAPAQRHLQSFKMNVYRHLLQSNWLWATDAL